MNNNNKKKFININRNSSEVRIKNYNINKIIYPIKNNKLKYDNLNFTTNLSTSIRSIDFKHLYRNINNSYKNINLKKLKDANEIIKDYQINDFIKLPHTKIKNKEKIDLEILYKQKLFNHNKNKYIHNNYINYCKMLKFIDKNLNKALHKSNNLSIDKFKFINKNIIYKVNFKNKETNKNIVNNMYNRRLQEIKNIFKNNENLNKKINKEKILLKNEKNKFYRNYIKSTN